MKMPGNSPNYSQLLLQSAVLKAFSKQAKPTIRNETKTSSQQTPTAVYHNHSSTLILTAVKEAVMSNFMARTIMDYLGIMVITGLVTAVVLTVLYIIIRKQKKLSKNGKYDRSKDFEKEQQGKITLLCKDSFERYAFQTISLTCLRK